MEHLDYHNENVISTSTYFKYPQSKWVLIMLTLLSLLIIGKAVYSEYQFQLIMSKTSIFACFVSTSYPHEHRLIVILATFLSFILIFLQLKRNKWQPPNNLLDQLVIIGPIALILLHIILLKFYFPY